MSSHTKGEEMPAGEAFSEEELAALGMDPTDSVVYMGEFLPTPTQMLRQVFRGIGAVAWTEIARRRLVAGNVEGSNDACEQMARVLLMKFEDGDSSPYYNVLRDHYTAERE